MSSSLSDPSAADTSASTKATGAADTSASTNGWDTVYAIYFTDVNKAIVSQKSSPTKFEDQWDDDDFGVTIQVDGNFGDWVLTGGDGALLHMTLPITNASLTMTGKTIGEKKFDFSKPFSAKIEVNLLWISDLADVEQRYNLKNDAIVSVSSVDAGDNKESDTHIGYIRTALENWLKKNPGAFDHVFASIDINTKADKAPGLQWLKPTDKLYAVTSVDDDPNKSIFGVLCMTGGRKSPDQHQVSKFAIPDKANSGFLIAPERILSDMLLKGLPSFFPDTQVSDFVYFENNYLQITNNKEMKIAKQSLKNGRVVEPTVAAKKFILSIEQTYIQMSFEDLTFEYSPGITIHVTHIGKGILTIQQNKFSVPMGDSTTTGECTTSTAFNVGNIIGAIGLSIAGAVLGGAAGSAVSKMVAGAARIGITVATDTAVNSVTNITTDVATEAAAETSATVAGDAAATPGKFSTWFARNWMRILGSMCGAGAGAEIGAIPDIVKAVANGTAEDIPTLDLLGTEVLSPITWPNLSSNGFELVSGDLNGSFRMGYNLKPKSSQASSA